VYNDGLQTVIEMPFAMKQTEAPTLLIIRAEGGVFTSDDLLQVNFHADGTKYIVDMVFDVADLIVGVGSNQQKVRIRRR
jgi:type IV secretion system protein TrbG